MRAFLALVCFMRHLSQRGMVPIVCVIFFSLSFPSLPFPSFRLDLPFVVDIAISFKAQFI